MSRGRNGESIREKQRTSQKYRERRLGLLMVTNAVVDAPEVIATVINRLFARHPGMTVGHASCFSHLGPKPHTNVRTRDRFRPPPKTFQNKTMLLGVDSLDATRGLVHKFLAVEDMFEMEPGLADRVNFVQVTTPHVGGTSCVQFLGKPRVCARYMGGECPPCVRDPGVRRQSSVSANPC